MHIPIKSPKEIKIMREGGKIHAEIMGQLEKKTVPGIATIELDELTRKLCKKYNAEPSFLGFQGYPGAICTSINDQIVHGIPDNTLLKDGDILSIDLGIYFQKMHTDACVTLPLGTIPHSTLKLLMTTKRALAASIAQVKDGVQLGDISNIIQTTVENDGFNVVRNLTGHGIGYELHESPQILNFGEKDTGMELKSGMTIAIEPIVVAGEDLNYTLEDDWTIVTRDGSLAAHFEHTILVTDKGAEILTN